MAQAHIATLVNPWKRELFYLSTEGDEVDPTNTLTAPVTVDSSAPTANKAIVICSNNYTQLCFIGTNAANKTCTGSIYAWSKQEHAYGSKSTNPGGVDYVPSKPEIVFTATLGAKVGIANGVVIASEFYADTLTVSTAGPVIRTIEINSQADNGIAWIILDNTGHYAFEVQFDLLTAASFGVMSRSF